MSKTNISIIGFGKLGSHLYYSLKKTGKVNLNYATKRSKLNPAKLNASNIIFICVQDYKIPAVVKKLSSKSFELRKKCVFHTSGSLSSDELIALRKKGAYTGSFHPVQTFEEKAKKHAGRFENIYIAIEGDSKSVQAGIKIAKLLKAKPFIISKDDKIFHHIRSVFASGYLASHVYQTEKILHKKIPKNGFKKLSFFNIYKPLALQTLKNISQKGAVKSLTGPVERNDFDTIIKHLKALKQYYPDVLQLYAIMGIQSVKLALKRRSIKPNDASRLLRTFNKYLKISKIS
jgi:predicted short-subunit dehydrogenase-like oxidoreductase (DUF2520 family)